MTLTNSERSFLPAAGRDLFLPLYDPLTSLLGLDRWRRALLDQAQLRPHHRVLDVGFVDAGRLRSASTIFGRLVFYRAIA